MKEEDFQSKQHIHYTLDVKKTDTKYRKNKFL